ncbi:MAG: phytanoyl-CoA dioxygenase [Methylococcaceae bacterium]|nr:phytanoyl-CoA dioxygenase [Methylococcaceae bacterium]
MQIITDKLKADYYDNGFVLLKKVISDKQITTLLNELNYFNREMNHYGVRDLMSKVPCIFDLAYSKEFLQIAQFILGEKAKPIRSVFFDKIPQANWNVAWHQDTSIAVSTKADLEGFKLWRIKQGVVHVEPPERYLVSILTLRLHLDTTTLENGALRVIPKSHKNGRINAAKIAALVEENQAVSGDANAGDVLLMNPLLLHASRKAITATHRRIIHIEYSAMDLPAPLIWHET